MFKSVIYWKLHARKLEKRKPRCRALTETHKSFLLAQMRGTPKQSHFAMQNNTFKKELSYINDMEIYLVVLLHCTRVLLK
jgi:hypothetical protein